MRSAELATSDYLTSLNGGTSIGAIGDYEVEHVDSDLRYTQYATGEQLSPYEKVRAYMEKLRVMGYDAPDSGDAYNQDVQSAVRAFQEAYYPEAGEVDGLVGPTFYRLVDREYAFVLQALAEEPEGPHVLPPEPGPVPTPLNIDPPPPPPIVDPVVDRPTDGDNTKKYLLYGGAAIAGVVVLALLFGGGGKQENPRRRRKSTRRRRARRGRR